MPKKNLDEEKKKELERLITEIKEKTPEESMAEVESLEKALKELIEEDTKPLGKRIIGQIIAYMIHLITMYVIALVGFGFFFKEISFENKFLIFIVAAVISIVLVTFERIPRNPFRKHFIKLNLMIFAMIIMAFCILNQDVFRVFSMSAFWVLYIIAIEAIYFLVEYSVLSKIRFV